MYKVRTTDPSFTHVSIVLSAPGRASKRFRVLRHIFAIFRVLRRELGNRRPVGAEGDHLGRLVSSGDATRMLRRACLHALRELAAVAREGNSAELLPELNHLQDAIAPQQMGRLRMLESAVTVVLPHVAEAGQPQRQSVMVRAFGNLQLGASQVRDTHIPQVQEILRIIPGSQDAPPMGSTQQKSSSAMYCSKRLAKELKLLCRQEGLNLRLTHWHV